MHTRHDIHGEATAPYSTEMFLLKFGGKTPHGEPYYRLIHTSSCWVKRGGVWNEWPKELSTQERGGMMQDEVTGLFVPSQYKPLRQVPEVREVRKYAHIENRWILERWCPAHMFGSRANWERMTVPDHPELPILGPYPEFGDYQMAGEPTVYVPEQSQLEEAIQNCEMLSSQHRGSVEQECLLAHNRAVAEYERERAEFKEALRLQMLDVMIPTNRVSLAAGRHRNELAKRAGITEHCGN